MFKTNLDYLDILQFRLALTSSQFTVEVDQKGQVCEEMTLKKIALALINLHTSEGSLNTVQVF